MWLKMQPSLKRVHKLLLKYCLLHCIVNHEFDDSKLSENATEHSLRLCLGAIVSRLVDSIDQDTVQSISNLDHFGRCGTVNRSVTIPLVCSHSWD